VPRDASNTEARNASARTLGAVHREQGDPAAATVRWPQTGAALDQQRSNTTAQEFDPAEVPAGPDLSAVARRLDALPGSGRSPA